MINTWADKHFMTHTRTWLVALTLLLLAVSSPLMAEMDVRQIQTLMSEGKLDQALKETDALLAKDKANIQALFVKGLILTRMNQLAKAEEIFLELNQNNPELPEPYNNLAVIYASRGEYDKAREALLKAINTHPSYATAYENIGDIYAKMASQAYNQALELDSGNSAARQKLSMVDDLFSAPPVVPTQVAAAPAPAPVTPPPVKPEPAPATTIAEPVEIKTAPVPAVAAPTPTPAPVPKIEPKPEPIPAPAPAPQPAPVSTPIVAEDDTLVTEAITNSVNNWAKAWSSQNVDAYLSAYSADYTPGPDISRPDWVAQRRARITSPGSIKVGVSGLRVIRHGNEHAQATFQQDYESDTYNDSVNKTLLFRLLNGRWLIVQEKSD